MIARAMGHSQTLRVRFEGDGRHRAVIVEGSALAEVERRRLQRLLKALPIQKGSFVVRNDWAGRPRVSFKGGIPEPVQQTIRNILGNLSRLRST